VGGTSTGSTDNMSGAYMCRDAGEDVSGYASLSGNWQLLLGPPVTGVVVNFPAGQGAPTVGVFDPSQPFGEAVGEPLGGGV
jgi:hypothetical protein